MPRELDFFFPPGRSEAMLSARRFVSKGLVLFQTLPSQSAIGLFLTLKWLQNSPLVFCFAPLPTLLLDRLISWNLGRFVPAQL